MTASDAMRPRSRPMRERWLNVARRCVLRRLEHDVAARRARRVASEPWAQLVDAWRHLHAEADTNSRFHGIAVDFETTGLNPTHDHLLSIGWVPIDGPWLRTDLAREIRVRSNRDATATNAAVHGILDDDRHRGQPVAGALAALMRAAAGRVWVLHFAAIERRFLEHFARRNDLPRPIFPWIDTLELALTRDRLSGQVRARDAYRLAALRDRLGLPPSRPHNALSDALATAELWLALDRQHDDASSPHSCSRAEAWHGPGLGALSVATLRCATLSGSPR